MKRTKKIGVFDSGFGGLDILRGMVRELPEYDYVYLGDTARAPYGGRSREVIYEFTRAAVDFLFAQGCDLIILACNTASAEALRKIQQQYLPKKYPQKRVLGVLIPAVEEAVAQSRTKRVGVMATDRTVESKAFPRELRKFDRKLKVFQKACPLLVPFVETGAHRSEAGRLVLREYLRPLLAKKVDTLILGCTHYGILAKEIRKIIGRDINIICESLVVPKKLRDYLRRHPEMEKRLTKRGKVVCYTTDLTWKFQVFGSKFFGKRLYPKKISLA